MKGFVDVRNRALLPIQVASSLQAEPIEILVWIDTAFDGHLVFSKELVRKLQLDSLVETEAVLADGSKKYHGIILLYCGLVWAKGSSTSH